ncbi:MAG: hypothetical protein ACE5GM_10870 [bacterium]
MLKIIKGKRIGFVVLVLSLLTLTEVKPADCQPLDGNGQILIIASRDFPVDKIKLKEVRDIFKGKAIIYSGVLLRPCNLSSRSRIRKIFEKEVVKETPNNLKKTWLKIALTSQGKPPLNATNIKVMLLFLSENQGGIGYLSSGEFAALKKKMKDKVKILLRIDLPDSESEQLYSRE